MPDPCGGDATGAPAPGKAAMAATSADFARGGCSRPDRRALLRAGASALALAACPHPARGQVDDTLRIGALVPVTGEGSPYGTGMRKAILAAAADVNLARGAGARRIEVFTADCETRAETAARAAAALIGETRVHAIVGTWSGAVTLAVIPLALQAGVIQMTTSGTPEISAADDQGLVWRFQATGERLGMAFAEVCRRRGFSRPATMAFSHPSTLAIVAGFRRAWEATGGKVVADTAYDPRSTTYRDELRLVLEARPDVIVGGSFLHDTAILLREWTELRGGNRWVLPGWAANAQLVRMLGPGPCEGIVAVDTMANEKAPSFARFENEYRKEMQHTGMTSPFAAMAWDMVVVLALAAEAAGPGTPVARMNAKIREVTNAPGDVVYSFAQGQARLRQGRKIDYDGASGRLDFDRFGDANPDFAIDQIEQGRLVRRGFVSLPR